MRKRTLLTATLALTLAAGLTSVSGQTDPDTAPSRAGVGPVDIFADGAHYSPTETRFTGHVRLTSANYDLAAAEITLFPAPKSSAGGAGAFRRATAEGGPGAQVTAHIRRPLQSEDYQIQADHAVYLPEPARPGGGRLDFTGHVKVVTRSGFLAGPSVATTDRATVLLGSGADFPQVETGPAHLTFTPAQ